MNNLLIHIIRLIVFVLAQGLIFGQLEFGVGIHPMIYPLFILLLPFDISPILLIVMAFITGISVDFFMNTFGLHASAAVLVAYIRPELFRLFAPRDGYDVLKEPTASEYGYKWFLSVAGIAITIHHAWFFLLEHFSWSDWLIILRKTVLSVIVTMFILLIIQILFFKKPKTI
ncbi:MAG: hypothetical protein COA32_00280 [Fluviicola sp.]|nr:MAG: hypothetical protein COA32_00280 [Fluviicola sp.]